MKTIAKKLFETSDFYLACFLLSKDFELSSVEPLFDDHKKKNFVFAVEQDIKINELVNSFYNGKGLILVNKYVHCIKDLKSYLHQR